MKHQYAHDAESFAVAVANSEPLDRLAGLRAALEGCVEALRSTPPSRWSWLRRLLAGVTRGEP